MDTWARAQAIPHRVYGRCSSRAAGVVPVSRSRLWPGGWGNGPTAGGDGRHRRQRAVCRHIPPRAGAGRSLCSGPSGFHRLLAKVLPTTLSGEDLSAAALADMGPVSLREHPDDLDFANGDAARAAARRQLEALAL